MAIRRRQIHAPRPPAEYTPSIAVQDARRLATTFALTQTPFDVEGLARSIGIRVSETPLPDNISGYLKKDDGVWLIGVNAFHHPNRKRFTLAHELGHYFLHRDKGEFLDETLFRNQSKMTPYEWDANRFAAMLLMPQTEYSKLQREGHDLESLASIFGVSVVAAKFRQENLQDERVAI